jgi:hypothetical protein
VQDEATIEVPAGLIDDLSADLRSQNARLMEALELCMVGGNHLANYLIGACGAGFVDDYPAGSNPEEIMVAFGPQNNRDYDVWCCWDAIMRARSLTSPLPVEETGDKRTIADMLYCPGAEDIELGASADAIFVLTRQARMAISELEQAADRLVADGLPGHAEDCRLRAQALHEAEMAVSAIPGIFAGPVAEGQSPKEACGECHLQAGEVCDVCGACQ